MNRVKLKDIAEINPRKSEIDKDSVDRVSFVAMADVSEDGFIANHETVPLSDVYSSYTYFKKGDVLLAKITPCFENGKAAIANDIPNEIGFGSTEFHVLRTNGKALPKYVFYALWNDNFRLTGSKKMTGSAGQKRVPTKFLKNYEIPLPTLDEQKAIVAKLDRAQRLIDIDNEMLAKYDELIQSVFLEMFGDPVTNPKGWDVRKLGDILENKDSARVPVKKSDRKEMAGEYPYYGASGIVDYVDDYIFEGPNLLIGEDGANLLSRSTDIAFIADGKYWVNNHAHVLGSDRIDLLHYVRYFINNLDLEPYITGSAQPKLNKGNLNEIEIPLPGEHFIEEFERKLSKISAEQAASKNLLKKSEELFSSLVQEAFNQ